MNAHLFNQLQELNFSPNESGVYLALLEIGQTSAGDIIKKTQLHRSVVYETLDRLIEKKLVLKLTKQNIAYFQVNDPERIMDHIRVQEEVALDLIPNLKTFMDKSLPEITVYEGIKSYQRFWLDSIMRMPIGSTDYVAGSIGGPWVDFLGPISERYFKIAQKRNIGWKMIVFDIDDYNQTFLSKYPQFHWECRLINKHVSKEGNFNIFGDESVILHSATEPMVIEIKNNSLVKVFKNIFDILWGSGEDIKIKMK